MKRNKDLFDMMLGRYCGPALAGIKPANMICIKKDRIPFFKILLKEYNKKMNRHDIFFSIIKETEASYLMMAYRKNKLSSHLASIQIFMQLHKLGYPDTGDIDLYLDFLRARFKGKSDPPYEIGLFLGYPVEDIIGFNKNKGKNALLSKYWKVYSNVNEAEKLFCRYDKCRNSLCNHLTNGSTIMGLFTKNITSGIQ